MPDRGLTHIALAVSDLGRSLDFSRRFAGMEVVHRRPGVAWISDRTRPFAIVLAERGDVGRPLGPFSHLGVACSSREEVDRLAGIARAEGRLRREPEDGGPVVGYWCFIDDPDGHTLELTFGQDVAGAVAGLGGPNPDGA